MTQYCTNFLVRGAHVVTVDDRDTTGILDILVQADRIADVGTNLTAPPNTPVFNAKGLVAMPGFVQAHVHLCQTLFRGMADDLPLLQWLRQRIWPMEAALDAASMRAAARLGLTELLLGGTTSILDMGSVHHTEVLFEEAAAFGMRYTGGKTLMDLGDDIPAKLLQTSAQALAESVSLCNTYHRPGHNMSRYAFSPRFAVCCSEATLRGSVALARRHGALLHTHASENQDEVALVRARVNMDNVAYLHALGFCGTDTVLAHGVWLSVEEKLLLQKSQTCIAHCPSSNLKLGSGIAQIEELLAMGIPIALGADGAPCNNSLDGFTEMRLAALLHKVRGGSTVVPARTALRMATRGGAQALGLHDCGRIAPGMCADFILCDLHKPHIAPHIGDLASRLVYAAQRSDVHSVFVNGRQVVHEGHLLVADINPIMTEAHVQGRRLAHAVGLPCS